MNEVPQTSGKIFLDGLKALDQPDTLAEAGITHILSVLEFDYCDYEEFAKYKRLLIQVEDHPGEDLIVHFPRTNGFLDHAIAEGGTVLVHCAMGISRSSTVVCAYLMYKDRMSFQKALETLREVRPLCTPNEGFMEQLQTYGQMLDVRSDTEANKIYSDWSKKRNERSKM